MSGTKPEKSHKIVLPLIVIFALAGSILGGVTGISILYIIGMLALVIVLAAATWSSRKSKLESQSDNDANHGASHRASPGGNR